MTEQERRLGEARARLARAFEGLRYGHGTIGYRDAMYRDIPNAIEALVEAKFALLTEKEKTP